MRRSIHRLACAAVVLAALAVTGCEWKRINIRIPDFETNLIQGMQLWRADDQASEIFLRTSSELPMVTLFTS